MRLGRLFAVTFAAVLAAGSLEISSTTSEAVSTSGSSFGCACPGA